jgi:hypothetical protein
MNDSDALCICGTDAFHACHWDSPTGSTSVAFSCSPQCEDIIEALRDSAGVLTAQQVRRARAALALALHLAATGEQIPMGDEDEPFDDAVYDALRNQGVEQEAAAYVATVVRRTDMTV